MGKEEADIQSKILDFLEEKGFMVVKFHNGSHKVRGGFIRARKTSVGIPDIIGMTPNGRFIGVEVKKPGGVATKEQKAKVAQINASGGVAVIVESLGELIQKLTIEV